MSHRTRWLLAARLFGVLSAAALALAVYAAVPSTGDPSWSRVQDNPPEDEPLHER